MGKVRVSAVSYLNSIPFVYGLEQSDLLPAAIDLSLDIPSVCAEKLLSDEVDLGLIPVATIPDLSNPQIISEYCIGADGPVQTVCLFSSVPLENITTVLLDFHSRTSVQLVQILCKHFWKITPDFTEAKEGFEQSISENTAAVIIGDRAYQYREQYQYVYDLAEEWEKYTGLPFVFACWVANKPLPISFQQQFSLALKMGLKNLDNALEEKGALYQTSIDKHHYLSQVISYDLDDRKKEGMELFLRFLSKN
jgi:chorismate dehydratase